MKIIGHRLCYDDGSQVEQRPSPNHGGELVRPRLLLWHYTAGRNAASAARWLCDPVAKASAHLIIGADGVALQLVPFDRVAWHAGKSEWTIDGQKVSGINHYSIGIELDNPGPLMRQGDRWRSLAIGTMYDAADVIEARHRLDVVTRGWHVYPQAQIEAAIEIARLLVNEYGLTDMAGHEDVAPTRKRDPGPAWPMEYVRTQVFGRMDDGEA